MEPSRLGYGGETALPGRLLIAPPVSCMQNADPPHIRQLPCRYIDHPRCGRAVRSMQMRHGGDTVVLHMCLALSDATYQAAMECREPELGAHMRWQVPIHRYG